MGFTLKTFGVVAGAAILSLGMIACHSQYPGSSGYVPTTTSALPASAGDAGIDPMAKGEIRSGCGHRLHIVIAGIIDCRFREKGYRGGTFTIVNDETGLVEVYPTTGTRATTFTITGLVAGSGHILVKDKKGNKYKIRVTVTI